MTEENQKILYEHFLATKQKENAEAILIVYPHFADTKTKSKEKK